MSEKTRKYDPMDDILDRPIAFNPSFKKITGSTNAALLLSQAFYWTKRTKDPEGWFFKTREEWMDETGMTESELDGARTKCRDAGLMEEKLKGVPATLHYRVNKQKVYELLGVQIPGFPESSFPGNSQIPENLESGISGNFNRNTETTTGITTLSAVADRLPLDWKVATGQPITEDDLQKSNFDLKKAVDTANSIGDGQAGADGLALAFQEARRINLSDDPKKIKAQRRAAREMLEMHVKPEHVTAAVRQLIEKNMTVTDLFSISKTAIALANPLKTNDPTAQRTSMLETIT